MPTNQGPPPPRIVLLSVPHCPLVEQVRKTLADCVATAGVAITAEERVEPCASPTLLIDGHDVTGRHLSAHASCRLDLPTPEQILAALVGR